MIPYEDDTNRINKDAKQFLESEYGKFQLKIIDELIEGALSDASNIKQENPDRYLARYAAFKEVKEVFQHNFGD